VKRKSADDCLSAAAFLVDVDIQAFFFFFFISVLGIFPCFSLFRTHDHCLKVDARSRSLQVLVRENLTKSLISRKQNQSAATLKSPAVDVNVGTIAA
jgi:hypothetical protein